MSDIPGAFAVSIVSCPIPSLRNRYPKLFWLIILDSLINVHSTIYSGFFSVKYNRQGHS